MFSMQPSRRCNAYAAVVSVSMMVAAFSACGGSDSTSAPSTVSAAPTESSPTTDVPVATADATAPSATYVVVGGDTLSGIAGRAGISLDDLVAVNGWPDGADHAIFPGDIIDLPEGASTPTPAAGSTATTSIGQTSSVEPSGGYGAATVDLALTNDRTTAVAVPLADGVYYASEVVSDGRQVTFTLGQWFVCDGEGVADRPTVECASGFGTLDDPSATVQLDPNAVVSVATGDLGDMTRSDVDAAEYARLLDGSAPAADAPAGYVFMEFATWVEVRSGVVVAVQQLYTS